LTVFWLSASSLLAIATLLLVCARLRRHADIAATAAANALAACQRDKAFLAAGLAGAGGGILVLDEQQHLVAANETAIALAQLPPHAWRGRALQTMVPWPRLHEWLAAARNDAALAELELEHDDAPEEHGRAVSVHARSLPGLGFVIAIDDHSRIKRLESLRRDFVANVSHELKTPLAAIQGYVETLLDDGEMPPATRLRFLQRIASQCTRLATLVSDLLTLSRLDDQRGLDLRAEPCDLATVVRETVRDLLPLAERRRIAVGAKLGNQPFWLHADREGLRQVVGNLVDNAIKYTPEGGRVAVQLAAEGNRVRLEVIDTGIGLSPADQERVFERFYRVDRARSREVGGTGLGLSIVKNTVRNLGGEVGVRSAVGAGSTFWVVLPMQAGPAEAPA